MCWALLLCPFTHPKAFVWVSIIVVNIAGYVFHAKAVSEYPGKQDDIYSLLDRVCLVYLDIIVLYSLSRMPSPEQPNSCWMGIRCSRCCRCRCSRCCQCSVDCWMRNRCSCCCPCCRCCSCYNYCMWSIVLIINCAILAFDYLAKDDIRPETETRRKWFAGLEIFFVYVLHALAIIPLYLRSEGAPPLEEVALNML